MANNSVPPLGRITYDDFSCLSRSQRVACIQNWLRNEMLKPERPSFSSHILDDVRIGHEGRHYDIDKPVPERNYDELESRIFGDEEPVPYQLTDKEMAEVVERAVREVRDVTFLTDAGMAAMVMFCVLNDNSEAIGEHLAWGDWKPTTFTADIAPAFCGSGMHCQPSGEVMGQMFPELSSQQGVVVIQKDRLNDHFFRIHTTFVDLDSDSVQHTGRYMDKAIEKALQSEAVPRFVKSYWNLALSGFVMHPHKDQETQQLMSMSCEFSYKGDKYQVKIYRDSYEYRDPAVKIQINGKWEKVRLGDLPKTVRDEVMKMDSIARGGRKELTNIRGGILRDSDELSRNAQKKEDVAKD